MKRLVTLVTVLLVGLASVQAAQSDDQQKKKKKQTQTAQATPAPTPSRTQTSKRHVTRQTSSQQVTKPYSKKVHSNAAAAANYTQQNVQRTNKYKKQTNIVTNNNAQLNKKAFRHFRRTGNELSFNVARARIVRDRHDRGWWNHHYN